LLRTGGRDARRRPRTLAALGAALALAAGPFLGVVPAAATDDGEVTTSGSAEGVVAPEADQLSVDGDLRVGGTATIDPRADLWQPTEGLTFSQQWYADGALIAGEIGQTLDLTAKLQGATLSVEVTGALPENGDTPESSDSVTVIAAGEVAEGQLATGTPSITGAVRVGSALTADAGSGWSAGTTFEYLWLVDGVPVGSSETFVPAATHEGGSLVLQVTGSQAGYASETTATPPTSVATGLLTSATPWVSGTVRVGSKVTANPGTWASGTSLSYQWRADGRNIAGATSKTFTPQAHHKGKVLTVRVTGTKPGHTPVAKTSAGKTVAAGVFTAAPRPKIAGLVNGRAKIGKTVTAKPLVKQWSPRPTTFRYQWKVDGRAIRGATSATYTPKARQHGKKLTVTVKGFRAGYTKKFVTSAGAVVSKPYTKAPRPTIAGTVRVGSLLTARVGMWEPKPRSFGYQWYVGGKPVAGATSRTYTIRKADHGLRVKVKVTARKPAYLITRRTSDPTATVRWPVGVSVPRITDQPDNVWVKTGTTVSFTGAATGGRLKYQWQKRTAESGKWVNMVGKTSPKLTFTARSRNTLTEYRLRVRNMAGTKHSKAAVLWVDSSKADPYGANKWFVGAFYAQVAGPTWTEIVAGKREVGVRMWACGLDDEFAQSPSGDLYVVYVASGGKFFYPEVSTVSYDGGCELLQYTVRGIPLSAATGGVWRVSDNSGGWLGIYTKQWVRGLR
jgi:hypothetical protein